MFLFDADCPGMFLKQFDYYIYQTLPADSTGAILNWMGRQWPMFIHTKTAGIRRLYYDKELWLELIRFWGGFLHRIQRTAYLSRKICFSLRSTVSDDDVTVGASPCVLLFRRRWVQSELCQSQLRRQCVHCTWRPWRRLWSSSLFHSKKIYFK